MFERFAQSARNAVLLAIEEAGRRGDRRVFTDHILIGILHDPTIQDEIGVGPDAARAAAARLDRRALAAVGIDVNSFGDLDAALGPPRLPFTPGAKAILKRSLVHCAADKSRRIEPRHILEALRENRPPDPAAELLAELRESP